MDYSNIQIKKNNRYVIRFDVYREYETSLFDIYKNRFYSINKTLYRLLYVINNHFIEINIVASFFEVETESLMSKIKLINDNFPNLIEINNNPETNDKCSLLESSFNKEISIYSSPIYIEARLTNGCNLQCRHCIVSASPNSTKKHIKAEVWMNMINELERNNVFSIILTGGEVFYYREIDKIIPFLKSKNIKFDILTNGTMIKSYHISHLCYPNINLNISLDGVTQQTHEILRGKGSFNKTYANIKILIESGANVALTMVIHKRNHHEIEDFILFGIENKIEQISFILLENDGRAAVNKDIIFSSDEEENIIKKILCLKSKYKEYNIVFMDPLNLQYESRSSQNKNDTYIYCSAGTNRLAIYENGDVYPCAQVYNINSFNIGNIKEDSLLKLWNHNKLKILRGGISSKDLTRCYTCEISDKCMYKNCRLRDLKDISNIYQHHKICDAIIQRNKIQ